MAHEGLTWSKVKQFLDQCVEQEIENLAKMPPDHRLFWAQGRLQALNLIRRAPEAIAAMEGESNERLPNARSPRRQWESWVVESSNGQVVPIPEHGPAHLG